MDEDDEIIVTELNFKDILCRKDIRDTIVIKTLSEWKKLGNYMKKKNIRTPGLSSTFQANTYEDFRNVALERILRYKHHFYGKKVGEFKKLVFLNAEKRGIIAFARLDEQRRLMSRDLGDRTHGSVIELDNLLESQFPADDSLRHTNPIDFETNMDLFSILKKLDDKCRKILELSWLKEKNNIEVAELLGIHRNSVARRLKLCLGKAMQIGMSENGV